MKVDADALLLLQELARAGRGVLTTRDAETLWKTTNRQLLKNRLRPYLEAKILVRFCRGFYLAPQATTSEMGLAALSQRIAPHSIISLGTVLSRTRLIGTKPKNVLFAVKAGPSRMYEHKELGSILHFGFGGRLQRRLIDFGYTFEDGMRFAEPERALLDTLYFYQRGNAFFFNIYSDIAFERIDRERYLEYVNEYPNSRFRAFARSYIDGKS